MFLKLPNQCSDKSGNCCCMETILSLAPDSQLFLKAPGLQPHQIHTVPLTCDSAGVLPVTRFRLAWPGKLLRAHECTSGCAFWMGACYYSSTSSTGWEWVTLGWSKTELIHLLPPVPRTLPTNVLDEWGADECGRHGFHVSSAPPVHHEVKDVNYEKAQTQFCLHQIFHSHLWGFNGLWKQMKKKSN